MMRWYKAYTNRPPLPAHVSITKMMEERLALYSRIPPEGIVSLWGYIRSPSTTPPPKERILQVKSSISAITGREAHQLCKRNTFRVGLLWRHGSGTRRRVTGSGLWNFSRLRSGTGPYLPNLHDRQSFYWQRGTTRTEGSNLSRFSGSSCQEWFAAG